MLNERRIDVKNVVSIPTDGASAMIGKEKGAVQRLKEEHSDLLTLALVKNIQMSWELL